jgi:Cu(I)/Ag(I) efflux system protein CusF
MKHQLAVAAVLILPVGLVPAGLAQPGAAGTGHEMQMEAQKPSGQTHRASGTVTTVDQASSKVTISHGPVQTLKWPAMTMTFGVKDKALLGKLSPGKKVDFEFVQQGRDYVVTSAK